MINIDLDDIERIVRNISTDDGAIPCDWSILIGGECSCDYCPLVFNISSCLGHHLYRRLK